MQTLLKNDYEKFFNSLQLPEQKAIFVNTTKISTKNFLKAADFLCQPIPYEKCGFFIDNLKLGKHPLHQAGAFYIQDASAMFTVNAINLKGDE